jgi:hypothetical protein
MKFPLPLRAPPLKGMLRDRNDYLTLSVIARPAFIVGRGNLIFQDSGGARAAIPKYVLAIMPTDPQLIFD